MLPAVVSGCGSMLFVSFFVSFEWGFVQRDPDFPFWVSGGGWGGGGENWNDPRGLGCLGLFPSFLFFFSETIPETAFEREFRSLLFNAFEIYKEELDVINVMNELLV